MQSLFISRESGYSRLLSLKCAFVGEVELLLFFLPLVTVGGHNYSFRRRKVWKISNIAYHHSLLVVEYSTTLPLVERTQFLERLQEYCIVVVGDGFNDAKKRVKVPVRVSNFELLTSSSYE